PALQHVHQLLFANVVVPAGGLAQSLGCRRDLRAHAAVGSVGDAEVPVFEEDSASGHVFGVAGGRNGEFLRFAGGCDIVHLRSPPVSVQAVAPRKRSLVAQPCPAKAVLRRSATAVVLTIRQCDPFANRGATAGPGTRTGACDTGPSSCSPPATRVARSPSHPSGDTACDDHALCTDPLDDIA